MATEYTNYHGSDGAIKPVKATTRALGPKEILVKITHSGVCGTDLGYVPYGVALGHEGVGIVEAIGSDVTQFKVGERAGGGYHSKLFSSVSLPCVTANVIGDRKLVWSLQILPCRR
jgi:D-arabinose 1-dehydrogenase-like Zn-dependent alcohol dehydrogenase